MSPIDILNERNKERERFISLGLQKLKNRNIFISLRGDDGKDVGSKLTDILLQLGLSAVHLEDDAEQRITDHEFTVSNNEVFVLGKAWSQKETMVSNDPCLPWISTKTITHCDYRVVRRLEGVLSIVVAGSREFDIRECLTEFIATEIKEGVGRSLNLE